jgi:hypothetical protein
MYYVYAHTKPSGEIFYIGKGSNGRFRDTENRNRHWNFFVKKHGFKAVILAEFELEQDALSEEAILIAHFKKFGTLVNILDGGEVNPMSNPDVALRVAATKRLRGQYDGKSIQIYNESLKDRMKNPDFASRISTGRKKAQAASIASRIDKMRPIVVEIRNLRNDGWLLKDLANKFHMRESTVSNIINRKCYAQIS